jgi:hypothetical protein
MALLMRRVIVAVLLLAFWPACGAWARVYMTQEDALRLAFPAPQAHERRTLYLDEGQADRAAEAAGTAIETRVVPYYVGRSGGQVSGYAYFDTHLVRTLPETVMIRLTPEGAIAGIDIVSFDEPEDYKVSPRWLDQFRGRAAGDAARLPAGIRVMTGATLSARAITDAARRVLALHRLFVAPGAEAAPGGRP